MKRKIILFLNILTALIEKSKNQSNSFDGVPDDIYFKQISKDLKSLSTNEGKIDYFNQNLCLNSEKKVQMLLGFWYKINPQTYTFKEWTINPNIHLTKLTLPPSNPLKCAKIQNGENSFTWVFYVIYYNNAGSGPKFCTINGSNNFESYSSDSIWRHFNVKKLSNFTDTGCWPNENFYEEMLVGTNPEFFNEIIKEDSKIKNLNLFYYTGNNNLNPNFENNAYHLKGITQALMVGNIEFKKDIYMNYFNEDNIILERLDTNEKKAKAISLIARTGRNLQNEFNYSNRESSGIVFYLEGSEFFKEGDQCFGYSLIYWLNKPSGRSFFGNGATELGIASRLVLKSKSGVNIGDFIFEMKMIKENINGVSEYRLELKITDAQAEIGFFRNINKINIDFETDQKSILSLDTISICKIDESTLSILIVKASNIYNDGTIKEKKYAHFTAISELKFQIGELKDLSFRISIDNIKNPGGHGGYYTQVEHFNLNNGGISRFNFVSISAPNEPAKLEEINSLGCYFIFGFSEKKCMVCNRQYYLNEDKSGCIKCEDPNCIRCNSNNDCFMKNSDSFFFINNGSYNIIGDFPANESNCPNGFTVIDRKNYCYPNEYDYSSICPQNSPFEIFSRNVDKLCSCKIPSCKFFILILINF